MNWVKTYEAFVYENKVVSKEVEFLEGILKITKGSGVFQEVTYDKNKRELIIEQPRDLNPMDAGAVLSAINKEKNAVKKAYSGIKTITIGDMHITI